MDFPDLSGNARKQATGGLSFLLVSCHKAVFNFKKPNMVKAKFNGDAQNSRFACPEFNARKGNTVSMPNSRWDAIVAEGKGGLFSVISNDGNAFPAQKTVGPKA